MDYEFIKGQFTEAQLEAAIIELFEQQGYTHVHGENIHRQYEDILLLDDLRAFISDRYAHENLSEADMEIVKKKEADRILSKIAPDTYVIALAIEGKMKSSEQLAADLESLMTYGKSKIAFVIGGSLGLHADVMKRSDEKLSFSKMTLPHQLMKLVLLEQIYRAFRIMRGEPYHK